MNEQIKLPTGAVLSVIRDSSSYPDRFSVLPGQEKIFESEILADIKRATGITAAQPLARDASLPAMVPIEIERQKILRLAEGFEKAVAEALGDMADKVGADLRRVRIRCWIQAGYSEALDNGENMFGDYLYVRARLFPIG